MRVLIFAAAVVVAMCSCAAAQEYSLDQLVELNQTAIAKIKKVKLEFVEKVDGEVHRKGRWKCIGLKELYEEETRIKGTTRRSVIYIDRQQRREKRFEIQDKSNIDRLLPARQETATAIEGPLGRSLGDMVVTYRLGLNFQLMGHDNTFKLNELVAEADEAELLDEKSTGKLKWQTIKIKRRIPADNQRVTARIGLDANSGFLSRRIDIQLGEDASANRFVGRIDVQEVQPDLFFPTRATWTYQTPAGETIKKIQMSVTDLALNEEVGANSLNYYFPKNVWVWIWDTPVNPRGPADGFGFRLADGNGGSIVQFSKDERAEYAAYREKIAREFQASRKDNRDREADHDRNRSRSNLAPRDGLGQFGQILFYLLAFSSLGATLWIGYRIGLAWRFWSQMLGKVSR